MSTDPLNNPFLVWNGSAWLPCSMPERLATILYILGRQLCLLVWPHPLTHDYYHLQLQSLGSPVGVDGRRPSSTASNRTA